MSFLPYPKFRGYVPSTGAVLAGGKLYSYAPGTSTAKATYTTSALTTANANPTVLDSEGEAMVYLSGAYKFVLKTSADVEVWTEDNVNKEPPVLLLSATTVSFAADADTALYTVPTNKRCVLSHAVIVAGADAGATTTFSIGQNGAETDFIPANTLSNLDAQYDALIVMPVPNTTPLKIKSYAAATVIEGQVASQSGGAVNTVYLYGTLY